MTGPMRSALMITADAPAFGTGGSGIRQAHLLAALAGAAATDLVVASDQQVSAEVAALCRTVIHLPVRPRPARSRMRRRAVTVRQALLTGPSERDDWLLNRLALRRWWLGAHGGDWDVVSVEHAGLGRFLPRGRQQPWALTLHNVASTRAHEQLAVTSGARQRVLVQREEQLCRHEELRYQARWDQLIAVSDLDAAQLGDGVAVVPNGADVASLAGGPLPSEPRLLFTGSLNTLPNVEGLVWFLREVWPVVRSGRPDAEFVVAGRGPVPEVVEACRAPGVALHADVPDMAPHLEAARVVVVPVRVGSGTRLKALEGLGAGRVVIGTAIGLEGIDLKDGVTAYIEDSAQAFAEAVGRALDTSDPAAAAVAAAGRALAVEKYDWVRVGERFVEVLSTLAGSSATRRQA